MDAFKAAARSEEFMATGKDAMEMGGPASPCMFADRRVTEPTHPRPRSPDELGFESIVYEKAPPRATITLNRPEVLNAFDFRMLRELARACEDASWDDDDPRRRRHRRGPRVLRRRRPARLGRATSSGTERSTGSGSARSRTRTTGCARSASRRSRASTASRRRRQRAADGVRPRGDGRRRVHPSRRPRARLGAGGRRDAVAADHSSATAARARSSCSARRSPPRRRAEWGLVNRAVPAAELDARRRRVRREARARSCRRRRATRSSSSTSGATSSWHETVNHARDWLALSMLGDEAQEAVKAFLKRSSS